MFAQREDGEETSTPEADGTDACSLASRSLGGGTLEDSLDSFWSCNGDLKGGRMRREHW